jgi:Fe2+ transport system protein FeoA
MDEKGTNVDTTMHIRLTSVRPGQTCRLVGVTALMGKRGRHHGYRKHQKGAGGWFFDNPERRRRRQEKWEERQRTWEESKKGWNQSGGRGVTKRLLDLGLTKGCTFKVVQGSSHGPVLVEVRGTRIALGHELARRVIVEVLEEGP